MKSIPQHTIEYIDKWLEMRWKWEYIPGFSVAIAKDGKVLFKGAYGYADTDTKQKMTPHHLFRIASQSKTFTATSIMQLEEQGKLRIDDPVIMHLAWLKDHSDKRWSEVTIRQLLSHSAGVVRDGLDADYWQLGRDFPDKDQLHGAIMDSDLIVEPNTRLKYSNYGYSLLGEVIELVSGMSYNEYVTVHIIEPLGLKDTYPEYNDKIASRLSTGYTRQNLQRTRIAFPHVVTRSMSAATGFCSNVNDLMIYYAAQQVGSGKLLSDASKKEMQRVHWKSSRKDGSYGLGFEMEKVGDRHLFGHSGGFPGFITRTAIDPKDKVAVTVLTNCHGAWAGMIVKAIYGLIDEFGDEPPNKSHLKYEGRFVSLHGLMDIVAHAGGVRALYPNSWFPVDAVDKLSIIDDNTLRIEETSDFDNPGEEIKYIRGSNGRIEKIIDGGGTRFPSLDGDLMTLWT